MAAMAEMVRMERQRQDDLWGKQRHGLPIWFLIIGEEFGEAQRELLKLRTFSLSARSSRTWALRRIREELAHTAAGCLAAMEHIDEELEDGGIMPEQVGE